MSNDLQLLLRGRGGVMHLARVAALVVVLLLGGAAVTLLHGQVSEADKKKRDAFLKAREEMRAVSSPTPAGSPKGKPKPATKKKKSGKSAAPKPTSKTTKKPAAAAKGKAKKKARPTATPKKATKPAAAATPTPQERSVPAEALPVRAAEPTPTAPPPRVAPPTPAPRAPATALPDEITIEKSGLEEQQGYEPPPPPPPRRGFFARLFGGGGRQRSYRYLNRSVVEQIRRAPVQRSRWKFIIVHNSGTRQGSAKAFDYYHRRVRRMQNGMAYHFVVGNGTSTGDGFIEIGDRWRRQINGGHVHSDYLNNISLGICLVGDFNRDQPTRAQLLATEELIKYLRERCGKADGRAIGVRPHKEMNPPRWATDCPGDAFPYAWFRRF